MNSFRESMLAAAGRNNNNNNNGGGAHQLYRRNNNNNNNTFTNTNSNSNSNRDSDENLNFLSKNRRNNNINNYNDDSSELCVKLGRLSLGSAVAAAKQPKSGIDDLLSSTDGGKNDYDWLLTPPGTPLGIESQPAAVAPRTSSSLRSASATKASRLSVSQSETNHSTRPARSSSVTRSSVSVSNSHYTSYSSNRSSSILNTSSTSVSSYIRPSSPITRSPSTARPSTPTSRPTQSRSSTPSRVRPAPITSNVDKTRPSQNSRPSTPTSRPQSSSGISSTATRSISRPSTPTRRSPISSPSAATGPSISAGRIPSTGRSAAPSLSRPSSPSPRARAPQQPIVPSDFPHDTPPNLRTTLPDRPVSAGRSRPGAALTMKPEPISSVTAPRRHSSPIVSRGRTTESSGISRVHSNGHEPRSHVTDMSMRRPVKPSPTVKESNGFGRNISKKSLDMAIRHMDIKNGNGNARPISSTTLFPQSVRSAVSKTRSTRSISGSESIKVNGDLHNGDIIRNRNNSHMYADTASEASDGRYSAKLSEVDIYESSRYDAMLLKEDLKNTNWLHSVDDKSDQGSIFDHGFELLPEPFGLL
ncbi:hypothetical protein ACFE04_001406 [Oxalis oulophora]